MDTESSEESSEEEIVKLKSNQKSKHDPSLVRLNETSSSSQIKNPKVIVEDPPKTSVTMETAELKGIYLI